MMHNLKLLMVIIIMKVETIRLIMLLQIYTILETRNKQMNTLRKWLLNYL